MRDEHELEQRMTIMDVQRWHEVLDALEDAEIAASKQARPQR